MATQTPKSEATPADLFDVERWADATRKAGNDYLDLVERTAEQVAELELKTAKAVKLPAVTRIAETHGALTREFTGAYVTAARDVLKA
jgi:uncharacterized protein YqjF (DUF2071 family)